MSNSMAKGLYWLTYVRGSPWNSRRLLRPIIIFKNQRALKWRTKKFIICSGLSTNWVYTRQLRAEKEKKQTPFIEMIDCNFYRFIDNNPRAKFEPAASDLQTLLVFFQHPACVITPVNLVESAVFCFCNCKVK